MKAFMRATVIIVASIAQIFSHSLDEALLKDVFPPSSSKCATSASGTFNYTYKFSWSNLTSKWSAANAKWEINTFLAEMSHIESNTNRSWKIRFGRGGNIYSYVGPFGEAVPPQNNGGSAPFMDEVWQTVSVNGAKNNPAITPYFIHQAGNYPQASALKQLPFYSPNIARSCSIMERECRFVSWGQQADQPTMYTSSILYYSRYKDCGNGVVETTYVVHNNAAPSGDYVDWCDFSETLGNNRISIPNVGINVPWGGVRTTVLQDMLQASGNTSLPSVLVDPLPNFGEPSGLTALNPLGGYTTFVENLPSKAVFKMPCFDSLGNAANCSLPGANAPRLIVNGAFSVAGSNTNAWGILTLMVNVKTTVNSGGNGCGIMPQCQFWFTNARTGRKLLVSQGVLSWSVSGYLMLFWPGGSPTDPKVGAALSKNFTNTFPVGDEIIISYFDVGRPPQENRALAFVYGRDTEALVAANTAGPRAWYNPAQRMISRFGGSPCTRDYTVWTIISPQRINPGQSYYKRNYIITDYFPLMDSSAKPWVGEAIQGMAWQGDAGPLRGNPTSLILVSAVSSSFAVNVNASYTCPGTVRRCDGTSTPQSNTLAHFAIQCGNRSYVGTDTYHFSPIRYNASNHYYEPWTCYGQGWIRPTWKLLGYFVPGQCSFLQNAYFNPALCSTTQSPTSVPTLSPTYLRGNPTPEPSAAPSLTPTTPPSARPTINPTAPTAIPTGPTFRPTAKPTAPTASPSVKPTPGPTSPVCFTMPCYYSTGVRAANCSMTGAAAPRLIVNSAFSVGTAQTTGWGMLVLTAALKPTVSSGSASGCRNWGNSACQFYFTNARTGKRLFIAGGVLHWSTGGVGLYFLPALPSQGVVGGSLRASNFTATFPIGAEIFVSYWYQTFAPSTNPSTAPSALPSASPSIVLTSTPTLSPSRGPSSAPLTQPSPDPTMAPTTQPSPLPTIAPVSAITTQPSPLPTAAPAATPSTQPNPQPTPLPTAAPAATPSTQPTPLSTALPTAFPLSTPTTKPTPNPTLPQSRVPAAVSSPSCKPSSEPTTVPTRQPTASPSPRPSTEPSVGPSRTPTVQPTTRPSLAPVAKPTASPSVAPSARPSSEPSPTPSRRPSTSPSKVPSTPPSPTPSRTPSTSPSTKPTAEPLSRPTPVPSPSPTRKPSARPTTRQV